MIKRELKYFKISDGIMELFLSFCRLFSKKDWSNERVSKMIIIVYNRDIVIETVTCRLGILNR